MTETASKAPATALDYDAGRLRQFCQANGIVRLELFGSALRADFRADSDVDLLCTLEPERSTRCGLLKWAELQLRLSEIFGRAVDLVSRPAIERSRNPFRRQAILSSAQPIYVAG